MRDETRIIIRMLIICLLATLTLPVFTQQEDDPGPRWGHVLIYHPAKDQILLFGGARERGSYIGDTWIWDGDQWQQKDVNGPSPRGFCAVAVDEKSGAVVLHGGRGNERDTNSDTWAWNGSNWQQLSAESDFASDHHQMIYLDQEKMLLAYGGWNGSDVSGKTWVWQKGKWQLLSEDGPRKRAAFAMAYNKATKSVVLYGGLWLEGQYADIWEWQDGQWQQHGGPYDQSSLDHHAMIYDEKLQQVIFFGGKNYRYRAQQKTQTVSGSSIEFLTDEGPSPRHSIGLTYDSQRQKGYLYGGKEYQGDTHVALGDFWRWNGEQWEKVE